MNRATGELAVVEAVPRSAARRRALSRNAVRSGSVLLVLVAWEIYARQVNPIFLASPTQVLSAGYRMIFVSKDLGGALLQSLQGIAVGMSLATALGLAVGFLMGMSPAVEWAIEPYVTLLYSMPRVALIPILILWLGVDFALRVAIVFLGAFFPIAITVYHGIKHVDEDLLETSRAFAATNAQTARTIVVPSTIPYAVVGIRLGLGRALVGIIVAEMFASQSGLGGLVVSYGDFFRTAEMLVPIFLIAFLGLVLTEALKIVERRLSPWKARDVAP